MLDKSFPKKKKFVEENSPILKYRSHRPFTKFISICNSLLVRIWTYKNSDERAQLL